MKFIASTKMAAHNLVVNKSRTILTIIIVFVVSALIMALCLIGTNFYSNILRGFEQTFDKTGTDYVLMGKEPYNNSYIDGSLMLSTTATTLDEVDKVAQVARRYPSIVDSMMITSFEGGNSSAIFSSSANLDIREINYAYYDFPFNSNIGEMVSGRIWTASDNETDKAWLSEDIVKMCSSKGIILDLGTKFSIVTSQYNYGSGNDMENKYVTNGYEVAGIFKKSKEFNGNIILSAPYSFKKFGNLKIYLSKYDSVKMSFVPKADSYNYNESSKNIKAFVKDVNAEVGQGKDWNGKPMNRFESSFMEELQMTEIISLVVLGVLILLSFFILLLSIGSVANTIIISVDKNRKFIGLMKAMGLNNKGMKQIVYKEAMITILIGVGLALLTIFAAQGIMLKLINSITGALFMLLLNGEFTATFVLNPFVPIFTALAFVGFAILFARGSLNKMGKMDVISIINEVA